MVHMWPYFDPDYENLSKYMNPPRVCIDNSSCNECTLVKEQEGFLVMPRIYPTISKTMKVDSVNKPGILLEVVQVLSDLDLAISKAYITSDGLWFMDVFHVTDQQGGKITDTKTIEHIEKALGPDGDILGIKGSIWSGKAVGMHSIGDYNIIELIGTDGPGLLSEIFAVLANLHFNVLVAEVWTHNMRVACVFYVNDEATSQAVSDLNQLSMMEQQLNNLLRARGDDVRGARTNFGMSSIHLGRRLHQLMFANKDYESDDKQKEKSMTTIKPVITIDRCEDKGYSVVNIRCKDRSKLLFDIVCTLTDMQFVVFHASVSSDGLYATQELYIRHKDGCMLDTREGKEMVKCLEAAILRRVTEGFSLEICGRDRVGLLSDVTRILREQGLSVTRADVTTIGEQAMNVFYVRDASGNPVEMKMVEALRREIGQTVMLNVKRVPSSTKPPKSSGLSKTSFSFGSFLGRFLH
ncbi:ACT domain-containing protein ACR3 isoform X1 [Dendrobium catenatum]|uniref:ACT domain-containing protein ACR3 isoform X1 n=1 Tax=Dendrobium catenatum TaxID=906689 RepID=UPI0010A02A3B|nr:ACT domain-containing protein ACR3 isoform X1 [Dendrobium catenatum]XP_028555844.1 ACT domain-containing protein ACR3 isoform X1 [Dendrobium catenatum]